ncbi:hypothetical protein LTR10_020470 [Elasticomyces elasticus]|uniref:DUF4604 domain-containing protein n=1 Tax=Exophiala sideris TaxID=1016849 RepID=A0ABR0J1W2_9EURO|nr:hypothetical protein LTR10_020470 [Elasticomyces elasticus]KAK5024729.1 hypothetical protein LTS07_008575 [Exophiala sideris]KAK5030822.1 hypothetical protein LTR13_008176 [Exophiala sideris]KAK5054364.1 hypothetical protein LTR69_008979 [Exophiala sideris]KAK5179764.1 hypothetical protein LTR44_007932 [Eurotiomycetes sp. CCFEE 6388]
MAFKAKDLEMRGEYGGLDGRHNVQIARPKKDRLKTGDDDDDPVIVDEQGELVGKEEFERRQKQDEDPGQQPGVETEKDDDEATGKEQPSERQKVTEIGNPGNLKKRKAAKVVGAEDDAGGEVGTATESKTKKEEKGDFRATQKKDAGATKKKGKKIKLSFDDPEG